LNLRVGHVFYGGYIGAVVMPFLYMRFIARQPYLPMLDIAATYAGLGLALHRTFGCTNAGCCHGAPTSMPWGITFPLGAPAYELYGTVAVHPTQYYEALLGVGIFVTVVYWRERHRKVLGELFVLQVALYAVGRFVIEFFRGDPARGYFGLLSTSQWISLAMLAATIVAAFFLARRRKALGAVAQS